MNETGCPFCPLVAALEGADRYEAPSGSVSRRVALLPTAVAVLGNDQYYPGYTLVIARRHATELYHLSDLESTAYFQDMLRVARAIDRAFSPRKMNYELLGNTVAHLHWHLFPRYANDPNPTRPTWEHVHPPTVLPEVEYARAIDAIRAHLG
ncbi:MAG TPA: HIT family protein [Candidatus Methylomirabilis sp.]|nr:HIT family protein [Candidatus Methylomirabilis sp.]